MLHSTRCQLQINAILCSHECSFVWWSITTFSSISDRIVCGNQSVHTRYHTGMPHCSFVQLLCCTLHLWITIFDCPMLRHQLVFITKQVCQILHVCTSAMWAQDVATRLRSVTKRYFQLWLMTLWSQSDLLFLAYKTQRPGFCLDVVLFDSLQHRIGHCLTGAMTLITHICMTISMALSNASLSSLSSKGYDTYVWRCLIQCHQIKFSKYDINTSVSCLTN